MIPGSNPIFPPVFSYAEIHYRLGRWPSLLFRKQPEILFDAPSRIDPDRPVPLVLIIRDAHRFPVVIEEAVIRVVSANGRERVARFPYDGLRVDSPVWWDSFNLMPEGTGSICIHPQLAVRAEDRTAVVEVDNYPGSSRRPLTVEVSPTCLPTAEGWYHGDVHCHSFFTADQVEFGAPLELSALTAYCLGLDWMAATDHSYDLDDREDDYLTSDPGLAKWRMMQGKAALLNESLETFTVIPGEEVTCRTHDGGNCHLLALRSGRFIRGSGDSGEKGLFNATERSIGEAAAECVEWGGLACAAHPLESVSLPERLILNRRPWKRIDLETPGVTALQIHDGVRDGGYRRGMRAWVELLLGGKRIYAFGGSDSHGDMNRRRAVHIPFLSLRESGDHLLGGARTVVFARSRSVEDILDALGNGRAQVTEGPFIDLTVDTPEGPARPGDEVFGEFQPLNAVFKSTPEFGLLRRGRILAGARGERRERVLAVLDSRLRGEYRHEFSVKALFDGLLYIRAECETDSGRRCFTNPVWVRGE